ncbi:MAG: LytTR family transcriptional regulator [Lachnospiraceae bacterium]|nr:LytTR family transcriptional regulator [Lachnospiraceae bacterium]
MRRCSAGRWGRFYPRQSSGRKTCDPVCGRGEKHTYGKIRDLEEELAGQFYRIHRGYLINLSHVEGYDKTEVRMVNGDKLLLSRYKYDGCVQAYMDYISEESL